MNTDSVSRGYLHEDYRLFHIRDQKDIRFDAHFHAFDKVIFFLEGNVTYTVEGKSNYLQPQDILLIRHDAVHRPIISADAVYDRWILYLDREFLSSCSLPDEPLFSCFDLTFQASAHLLRLQPDIWKKLLLLLNQMQETEHSNLFGRKLLSRSLLLQILVSLCRCVQEPAHSMLADYASDALITQVVSFIQGHLNEDLSLDAMAQRFNIPASFLMHRFRKVTGYTLHAYVQLRRLLRAAELIAGGTPAGDASVQAGYHDYSVFSRAFTKRFGVSPSRYRPDIHPFRAMAE